MVWPHHALVNIWEGLAYVVMHALHKSNHHRGSSMLSKGKSSRLKGNPNFLCSLPWSFFYDEHTPCKSPSSNLAFFRAHLPYLWDYVHFLSINAHNSNLNNRCMKMCTIMVWKTMLVLFSTFSCLLQGMGRDFKEICRNSQPQTRRFAGLTTIQKWNTGLETWRLAWCHGMASSCPGKNWRMFSLCPDARLS